MKIGVFGLGISGEAVLKYLKLNNIETIVVSLGMETHNDHNVSYVEQKDYNKEFLSCDQVILSPGISRSHDILKHVLENNIPVISEIEFTLKHTKVPIVAITGSNGKTTTATMVSKALEAQGKSVFLGGNIGHAFSNILLDKTKYDYIVLELSSFQLESTFSLGPKIAIITNIVPTHMERYSSFESYTKAKEVIVKNHTEQTLLICPKANKPAGFIGRHLEIKAWQTSKKLQVVGEHNLYNLFCAYETCKELLKDRFDNKDFDDFASGFNGVEHRQELIEFEGFKVINDSKSTNFTSTLTAIKSVDPQSTILLIGGKKRSDDLEEFKQIQDFNFYDVLCFGEASIDLAKMLGTKQFKSLKECIESLKERSLKGKTVLFSPGFPSFDEFQNFEKRGKAFKELMSALSV